jgi:hypothetical protein
MRRRAIAALALAGLLTALAILVRDMRAAAVRRVTGPLLLDEVLPEHEFSSVFSIVVTAEPAATYRAALELPARDLGAVARALFAARGLPGRLLGTSGEQPLTGQRPLLEAMGDLGFRTLRTEADREIVFGDIGRYWSLRDVSGPAVASTEEFIAFADPAFAKVAANIAVRPAPEPGLTILQTETRVHVPDPRLRRRFAAYWLVIEAGSGLIRRRWLAAIARRAERGHEVDGRGDAS